ncbi:Protein kinase domain-containing protein [Fusarium sp. Ph1]|nr:Protein kinase domain-containing protein [Fusarium sp. Ph1]
MAHDVYSLGVCMLEILCWESVLQPCPPFVSPAFVETFTRLGFPPNEVDPGDYYTKFPNKNKAVLLSMSEILIPAEAGTKMTRIVCEFLTCLDRKGPELDEEPNAYVINDEADRIKVAMNFVDTALKDLRNIQASI